MLFACAILHIMEWTPLERDVPTNGWAPTPHLASPSLLHLFAKNIPNFAFCKFCVYFDDILSLAYQFCRCTSFGGCS